MSCALRNELLRTSTLRTASLRLVMARSSPRAWPADLWRRGPGPGRRPAGLRDTQPPPMQTSIGSSKTSTALPDRRLALLALDGARIHRDLRDTPWTSPENLDNGDREHRRDGRAAQQAGRHGEHRPRKVAEPRENHCDGGKHDTPDQARHGEADDQG